MRSFWICAGYSNANIPFALKNAMEEAQIPHKIALVLGAVSTSGSLLLLFVSRFRLVQSQSLQRLEARFFKQTGVGRLLKVVFKGGYHLPHARKALGVRKQVRKARPDGFERDIH